MPEYNYKCTECRNSGYYSYKMSEVPSTRECEKCGSVMDRRFKPEDVTVSIPKAFTDSSPFDYDSRPSGRKSHVVKNNPLN